MLSAQLQSYYEEFSKMVLNCLDDQLLHHHIPLRQKKFGKYFQRLTFSWRHLLATSVNSLRQTDPLANIVS